MSVTIRFSPTPDVRAILSVLLDAIDRHNPADNPRTRVVRCRLADLALPGYSSQVDPEPRQVSNQQLLALEQAGLLRLAWLPGETGHLLERVDLQPGAEEALFALLARAPLAAHRAALTGLLLAERFRFPDWRARILDSILTQLNAGKSPAPFDLADPVWNEDLLVALAALSSVTEETPYRVFSVRVFNDSKRFDDLRDAMVRLVRLARPDLREESNGGVLQELNLVPNPGYLYLRGGWELVDDRGQVLELSGFEPAVGFPAVQASRLRRARVRAEKVVCIENATTFYEYTKKAGPDEAVLCIWGNPSPACRHLLRCLAADLPAPTPLYVWADLDYGGFNILAQLREAVDPRCQPLKMDIETLAAYARLARPLSSADVHNLTRLKSHPALRDVRPVIEEMLARGIKLEQEAIEMFF